MSWRRITPTTIMILSVYLKGNKIETAMYTTIAVIAIPIQ